MSEVAGPSESSKGPLVLHANAPEFPENENLPPSAVDGKGGAQVQKVIYLFAGVSRAGDVRHRLKSRGNCVVEETDTCRGSEFDKSCDLVFQLLNKQSQSRGVLSAHRVAATCYVSRARHANRRGPPALWSRA